MSFCSSWIFLRFTLTDLDSLLCFTCIFVHFSPPSSQTLRSLQSFCRISLLVNSANFNLFSSPCGPHTAGYGSHHKVSEDVNVFLSISIFLICVSLFSKHRLKGKMNLYFFFHYRYYSVMLTMGQRTALSMMLMCQILVGL